jgi:hypothetical protein
MLAKTSFIEMMNVSLYDWMAEQLNVLFSGLRSSNSLVHGKSNTRLPWVDFVTVFEGSQREGFEPGAEVGA